MSVKKCANSRDSFNPRRWDLSLPERFIYLSDRDAAIAARVDEEDYHWAKQWAWSYSMSRLRESCMTEKYYAKRSHRTEDGRRVEIYLHKAILVRMGADRPSPKHHIGDHLNGDSLDCRRSNLRWATPAMNRRNLYGAASRQLEMDLFNVCSPHLSASGFGRDPD